MASTSTGMSKFLHGKSVHAKDLRTWDTEVVLDCDSDTGETEQNSSDTGDSVQDDGSSDSDMEDTVTVRFKEEATLWQAKNNSHKIMRHFYRDTGSSV
jgi:hypothetical protein